MRTLAIVAAVAHAALVVQPRGAPITLRASPRGPALVQVGPLNRFGGPLVLGVVRRRGNWAAVTSDELPTGRVGWLDLRLVRVRTVTLALHVSLGARRLELLRGTTVLRRFPVAVGASTSPTPLGTFSIAEKLDGARFGSVYGCCVLGLSAQQPHPPASWPAGTYLVGIHGGGGIGSAVSAGCIHVAEPALRYLMRVVAVGTPVTVSP